MLILRHLPFTHQAGGGVGGTVPLSFARYTKHHTHRKGLPINCRAVNKEIRTYIATTGRIAPNVSAWDPSVHPDAL